MSAQLNPHQAIDMSMPAAESGMSAVFYTSTTTPLFSSLWSPTSPAGYAATCIFLVMLAVAGRFLMAGRHLLEHRWRVRDAQRRAIIVRGRGMGMDTGEGEGQGKGEGKEGLLVGSRNGGAATAAEEFKVRPWRLSVDVPRSGYAVLLAGVGYLLMLAVMTMNVGYFMSVLGGIFLGELIVGRYIGSDHRDH